MPQTHTIKVHHDSKDNNYKFTPQRTDASPGDTVQFTSDNADVTVCFVPTDTVFGASTDVYQSGNPASSFSTSPGDDFTVSMCGAALNGSCTPSGRPVATMTGTIKVGS